MSLQPLTFGAAVNVSCWEGTSEASCIGAVLAISVWSLCCSMIASSRATFCSRRSGAEAKEIIAELRIVKINFAPCGSERGACFPVPADFGTLIAEEVG
jgi:hypothetical protein